MKRLLLKALVLIYMLSGHTFSRATTPQSCLLFSFTEDNRARLGVVNTSDKNMNLEIVNSRGEVYYSKVVLKGNNYFQLLDLNNMPEGSYTISLVGPDNKFEKEFEVNNHVASLKKKVQEIEPVFRLLEKEALIVSYLNSQGKSINILFEKNNEVVYEDRNLSSGAVTKKYSLKQLPRGDYTVKLYSGSRTYSYPLAVK